MTKISIKKISPVFQKKENIEKKDLLIENALKIKIDRWKIRIYFCENVFLKFTKIKRSWLSLVKINDYLGL